MATASKMEMCDVGGLQAMVASIIMFRLQVMRLAMAWVACIGEAKAMKTYRASG